MKKKECFKDTFYTKKPMQKKLSTRETLLGGRSLLREPYGPYKTKFDNLTYLGGFSFIDIKRDCYPFTLFSTYMFQYFIMWTVDPFTTSFHLHTKMTVTML